MKTKNESLVDWAINKIETEYKDDVCLLIEHKTLKLEKDLDKAPLSFFIPASEHAYGLAKTFIIDGIGYDLFPMSWQRIEGLAELKENITSCLGDAKILYYRNEEEKRRFLKLQTKLQDNLQNPKYMLNKALEKLNIAMEIYQTMMFEDTLYKVRKASGYIADFLSVAVASANLTYFKNGQTNQISDLLAMPGIPKDFTKLYEAIVKAGSSEELKKLCYEMIYNTRRFLSAKKVKSEKDNYNQNFKELASWYEELSYTWRRVYHWCDEKDAVRGFMWGCFLQSELDIVREEFGLSELDLLGAFDAHDLTAYRKQAETLEKQIVSAIEKHGVVIDAYDSIEDFLKKNA
ncbi:MAG: hypothetical protein Q7T57_00495 [Dehalococcoidales bacterium]|nr:hypothetical protein [Dehalococcoidales bacterium]